MQNCDQQHLEMLADKIIIDIKKDPFSYKNDIIDVIYTEEDFKLFESILISKMPNLICIFKIWFCMYWALTFCFIITHRETDTEEDLSNHLKRVKDIYLNNMQPYFVDFSIPKSKVKVKDN